MKVVAFKYFLLLSCFTWLIWAKEQVRLVLMQQHLKLLSNLKPEVILDLFFSLISHIRIVING